MAQHVNSVPEGVTQAGLDWGYANPPQFVTITLVNAPVDPDHLNVGLGKAAYDTFIDAQVAATVDPSTPGGDAWVLPDVLLYDPEHDLVGDIDFETAIRLYNYGRIDTPSGRSWYVFYTPVYTNPDATTFRADLDEFPSFDWELGYSQVERSHAAAAAASNAANLPTAWTYCMEPEPFTTAELISYGGYEHDPLGDAAVLVVSATDLRADPFVAVDSDVVDTMQDIITNPQATGTVVADDPAGGSLSLNYNVGNGTYDDLFYYPYAAGAGIGGGQMYRPFATGASPSMIDGIAAEGGAFVYDSVLAYVEHMALLAHAPWIAEGIARAVPIPGGSGGSGAGAALTPWDHVESTAGSAVYHSTLGTATSDDTVLTSDFRENLPGSYATWVKLTSAPFTEIQIGNRLGSSENYAPQGFGNMPELRLHTEAAYYPQADVAVWLTDANFGAAQNDPMDVPVAADLPHFTVGRDAAFAGGAAGIAAERAQSDFDMLLAEQRALVDNIFTLSSTYMATQYAIAETI
jgi:hypothetical protein